MCDFRRIQQIKLLHNNLIIDIDEPKLCNGMRHAIFCEDGTQAPYRHEVTGAGFYYIAASGSGYAYFDGLEWLYEGQGYKVTKYDFICEAS